MTTATVSPSARVSIEGHGIAPRIAGAVRAALARMKARHDCRKLLALGDEHFRDMGVTRADLRRALGD